MKENNELPTFLLEHTPWENETNPIWPASSMVLRRNLARHIFPGKQTEVQAAQVLGLLKEAFSKITLLNNPEFLKAESTSLINKEFIFEHFLESEAFQNTLPCQGFILDDSGEFLGMLNIGDHLQLQLLDTTGGWEKTWNRLSSLDTALAHAVDFAFSSRFGYLTADPTLCGTALVVQAYLHLPGLIHTKTLPDALIKQKEEEVIAKSLQGDLEHCVGDMVVLTNDYTLGLTEENILHGIHLTAMKLITSEKALREHLREEKNPEIKDKVSRAFGLLLHSYQITTKEALDSISLMKLGLDLGWVKGITDKKLNAAFFKCRRAHLAYLYKEKILETQDASQKRAAFIHKELQGMQLIE